VRAGSAALVLVTHPEQEGAEELVRKVVEEGLAACGTVLSGAVSIYRWEGAVQRSDECQLLLKTGAARVPELVDRVTELHPYDLPEVLALPVEAGLPGYLRWVVEESSG